MAAITVLFISCHHLSFVERISWCVLSTIIKKLPVLMSQMNRYESWLKITRPFATWSIINVSNPICTVKGTPNSKFYCQYPVRVWGISIFPFSSIILHVVWLYPWRLNSNVCSYACLSVYFLRSTEPTCWWVNL